VFIAYQSIGEGPIDVVYAPGWITHVEVAWEHPLGVRQIRAFCQIGRLIFFDKRGTGLSDRASPLTDLDTRAQDLLAVMDAAGSERAVLVGEFEGGALAAFVAATYPDRVRALVWWGGYATYAWAPDNPEGITEEQHARDLAEIEAGWGTEEHTRTHVMQGSDAPELAEDPGVVAWWAKTLRFGASPGEAVRFEQMWWETDVRAVLPSVQVPTLIVSRENDAGPAQRSAAAIPGAELVLLPPGDPAPIGDATEPFAEAVGAFVARVRDAEADLERVLATALFTDIVDSSATAAALGDRAWRELLEKHHATVRSLLDRFGGKEVDTAGDGFFATFDGPTRAVRCAQAIVASMRSLGIEVRAGVHTGEVETIAGKAGGIAVVIGARLGALARPMEVWVSSTVKDLTAGSGLVFEDVGEHELKGVPDRWRLYRVVAA